MSVRPGFDTDQGRPDGGRSPETLLATGESPASALARQLAVAVTQDREGPLHVVSPLSVPRSLPLDAANDLVEPRRNTVDAVLNRIAISATGAVRIGHDVATTLASAANEHDAGTIILPRTLDDTTVTTELLASIAARTRCNVVAVNDATLDDGLASVLVPVAGGPHSRFAVDVSKALAATTDVWVDLLHVIPEDTEAERADAHSLLSSRADRFGDIDSVSTWTLDSTDIAGTIREQSRYYDLTLIGAPRTNRLHRLVFGSTASTLRDVTRSPLAVVYCARQGEVSP